MHDELAQRYQRYLAITQQAFTKAQQAPENIDITDATRDDFLTMISCYIEDAQHFLSKGDLINAFAAITYAHGWLDAGARIGLWDVHDNALFTVDDKTGEKKT